MSLHRWLQLHGYIIVTTPSKPIYFTGKLGIRVITYVVFRQICTIYTPIKHNTTSFPRLKHLMLENSLGTSVSGANLHFHSWRKTFGRRSCSCVSLRIRWFQSADLTKFPHSDFHKLCLSDHCAINFRCGANTTVSFVFWFRLVHSCIWEDGDISKPPVPNVLWLSTPVPCCGKVRDSSRRRMPAACCHLCLLGQHPGSTGASYMGTEGWPNDVAQRRRGHIFGQSYAERGDSAQRRVRRRGREVLCPGRKGSHHCVVDLRWRAEGGQKHMRLVGYPASDRAGVLPASAHHLCGEAEARHPQGTYLDAEGTLLGIKPTLTPKLALVTD